MTTRVRSISPQRLHALHSAGEPVELIDVRTPAEYRAAHAAGAKLLPLDELSPDILYARTQLPGLGRDQPVYLMCQSGSRALEAAMRLIQTGHPNVALVEGGVEAWERTTDAGAWGSLNPGGFEESIYCHPRLILPPPICEKERGGSGFGKGCEVSGFLRRSGYDLDSFDVIQQPGIGHRRTEHPPGGAHRVDDRRPLRPGFRGLGEEFVEAHRTVRHPVRYALVVVGQPGPVRLSAHADLPRDDGGPPAAAGREDAIL